MKSVKGVGVGVTGAQAGNEVRETHEQTHTDIDTILIRSFVSLSMKIMWFCVAG